jgi:hypothetical protein
MKKIAISCILVLSGISLIAAPGHKNKGHKPHNKHEKPRVVHHHKAHRHAPKSFHGWRRGHKAHAHYRSCWVGEIWYNAAGFPCYSPEYLAVTPVANTVVITGSGNVSVTTTAPAPVVVTQPAPVVVTPAPVMVTPPPPPPRRPSPIRRLLHKLF